MQDQDHRDKHFFFYFSTYRLEAPQDVMKVSGLKAIIAQHVPGFNPAYTLVQEECGDRPDKPLADNQEVRIHEIPHFYDQPPANFG